MPTPTKRPPRARESIGFFGGGLALGALGWVFLSAPDTAFEATAHEPELSRFTYWKDIRPLLGEHCAGCHVGNSPAPVNLMRYTEVLPWANAIARQVLTRQMPPWLPEDGVGDLAHARTLDERETNLLVDWAIGLAPEGRPPEEGAAALTDAGSGSRAAFADDLPATRLRLEAPVEIGEMESEAALCRPLVRSEGVGTAASGFELLPGDAWPILRRARVLIGNGCETAVPLFTWVPGQGRRTRPDGVVDLLPTGSGLFLELRYRKSFDTEGLGYVDAPEIVVFPPDRAGGAVVETVALEPGDSRLPGAALLAVLPPDGLVLGDEGFAVQAVSADGEVEPLLRITRFDEDWAEKYAFRAPIRLDADISIRVSHPGALVDLIRPGGAAATGASSPSGPRPEVP